MKYPHSAISNFLFLTSCFAVGLTASAAQDTLRVERAQMWTPATTFHTYQIDSVNLKGEKFDANDLLGKNPLLQGQPTGSIAYGEAMPTDEGTLSQYAFRIRASRYAKANIKVEGIKQYKLYGEDGKELSASLTLLPGEQTVRLVALASKAQADTFRVSLTADSLYRGTLCVNAEGLRPYTWQDMVLGPQYSRARVSPTGRYALMLYYSTKRDGQWDQWATLTDLQTGRQLQRIEGGTSYNWLHGQDILYYTRTREGQTQFVILDPATQQLDILADNLPQGHYTLSPTRDYIIYSTNEEGREVKGAFKYHEQPDDRMPGWRNRSQLWRVDVRTGLRQRLTYGSESAYLNDISSDGKRLLLSFTRFDATRRPFNRTTLVEMNAYTGQVDTLAADVEFLQGGAQYLPGDRQFLITGTANAFDNVGSELAEGKIGNEFHYCLFLFDIATRKASYPMPAGFKPSVTGITVCPGDNAAYLMTEDGYDHTLFRLDAKTLALTRINLPISYATGYGVATHQRKPRLIAFGQDGGVNPRRCVSGLVGSGKPFMPFGEIRPENVNAGVQMAPCTEWQFQSSRGDSIKCFYYDLNGQQAADHSKPMIVYYYGGCSPTPRIAEMLYPFQVWAAQGYTVLVVQPSGASGFGQEFGSRHVGTWGEGSAQDIIEATQQFCREHAWVDSSKIGCIGASYGGFMTQYLQTQTDIFAAAISHAGISNIASYWGGGYWGYSYGECAEFGQFPWSDRELFVEHSPLFNADKIHTPLLLLHGTVDTNVPTTESIQLYTALKILGREVAYVSVDGENHVISDFNKRAEWARTIQAWFAKWLKGQPEWWEELYPAAKKNQGN
ncbi:MAG: prolyl oligopeptidase family serine peptidase [Bacteroidaceae bacterium]|nr:prolyl oligopeptidase family serine peptidase [Bacteroidaceae bacterium]